MVTKESTAHLLPEHWREEAKIVARLVKGDGGSMCLEAVEIAILDLLDRCVKEAVLLNTAELLEADRLELEGAQEAVDK